MTKRALIIGGGFAGCAAAHQLALQGGWNVTLIEKLPYLGAGVRTQWCGGHPYTFGPRHFLTPWDHVYGFLNEYLPLRLLNHEFITYVERDEAFYSFPIHKDDIARMPDREQVEGELASRQAIENPADFEEYWIQSVGATLYDKYINGYSKKMWQVEDNKEIDTFDWSPKGVTIKEGSREAWDTRMSAYPLAPDGYNGYFDLATAEAEVRLSTTIERYDIPHKSVVLDGEERSYDVIVNTIPPDTLFDHAYGELPFVGRDFHKIVLPMEHCFPENVYFIYYAGDEPFTRLVEYKRFTQHESPTTLIGMEIPSANGKHYPLPIQSEIDKADRYIAEMPDGVWSIGRNGTYRYGVDIDDCIAQAMEMARDLAS
jgi:UDP-galactopyranose mutase